MPQVPTVRVFVSSTWLDLQPERDAVEQAVQRLRETKFVSMEYFGSRDETTRRASLDEVDRSDVYVGLFGARYGSGITEAEYRRARELNLPCFVYFKADPVSLPPELQEDDATAARLAALKDELQHTHTVSTFTNPDNLAWKLTADLHDWLFKAYLPPLLEQAARGQAPRAEAQTLLDAVKDSSALDRDLVARLRRAGYTVAAGERSAAVGGNVSESVVSTGDSDVIVGTARGDVFRGDKIINEAPAPVISSLHGMPPPPGDFTGRESELAELTGQIERGGATISGLHGLGGIGKTALALKLAERLEARYPDAQFYLDLKGVSARPLAAAEALAHVVRAYHPTARLPEGEAELRALYLSVLHGRRALLLMDNAADRAQVEPLIPPDGCALLVTSRRHFTLPGLFAKDLNTLSPGDAHKLLLRIAPRIGSHADEIADLCGHLPLALRLAASALAERPNLTAADYLRRLADARARLELVEASLTLSYDLLTSELQKLWRTLSVFPDTFDTAAAAAVWEMEPDAAQDTLAELIRYSLLDWNDADARYRLHDLARLFASARATDDEQSTGRMRHAEHYFGVLRETNSRYKQGGEAVKRGLALFDSEWRNIQAGQSWAEKQSAENDNAASLCMHYPNAGVFTLDLRLHPRDKISWLQAALATARQLKNREAEGAHLGNLGLAYANLGETRRAVEFYEQALVIDREIGDRRGEANALINKGIALDRLGDRTQAIAQAEAALEIYEQIESPHVEMVRATIAEWRGQGERKRGVWERVRDWLLRKR